MMMDESEKSKRVIAQYEQDERTMVLIFAQWCVNHDLEPVHVYHEAYPDQQPNPLLLEVLDETVPKTESEDISLDIVLYVLQMFGNDDLAFVVQQKAEQVKEKSSKNRN